jgi:hypothetical protein
MRERIEVAIERMIEALDSRYAPADDFEEDDPSGGEIDDDPIDGMSWRGTTTPTTNRLWHWSHVVVVVLARNLIDAVRPTTRVLTIKRADEY